MALTAEQILALATAPRRIQGDEGSVEMRSAADIAALIKLADTAGETEDETTARRSVHIGQIRPGGGA